MSAHTLGGSTRNGDFVGIPRQRDDATGQPIHVLGVDHPTPRTRRTGETILVVARAAAEHVLVGRLWTAESQKQGLRVPRCG